MPLPFSFTYETLSQSDWAGLQQFADILWGARHEISEKWAARVMARLPEYFSRGDMSLEQLTLMNEGFLTLVLTRIREGDLPGLYETYYESNRRLIEADIEAAPARRLS